MKTQNKFSPIGALVGAGSQRPCDQPLSRAFQRYQNAARGAVVWEISRCQTNKTKQTHPAR